MTDSAIICKECFMHIRFRFSADEKYWRLDFPRWRNFGVIVQQRLGYFWITRGGKFGDKIGLLFARCFGFSWKTSGSDTAAIVWYMPIFRGPTGRRPQARVRPATHVTCLATRATQASAWPAGHAFCGPRKNSTQATIFKGDPNFFSQSIGPIVSYKFVKMEF